MKGSCIENKVGRMRGKQKSRGREGRSWSPARHLGGCGSPLRSREVTLHPGPGRGELQPLEAALPRTAGDGRREGPSPLLSEAEAC